MKRTCTILLLLATTLAFGQKIPFQGRLLNNNSPFTGTATIDFSITTPTWSETIPDVDVQDGYYAVVLGEITPLPENLFDDSPEITLNITVNGEALTPVTLYSPFLPHTGSNPVEIDTLNTLALDIIGESNNPKVRLGSSDNGFEGVILIRDSLDNTGAFMQTSNTLSTGFTRGYLQLNGRNNAGELRSAVASGASVQGRANSFMSLFGANSAGDGIQVLAELYASDIDITGTQLPDGYRRGGVDFYNYFGNTTHNIYSEHIGTSTISNLNLNASQDGGGPQFTLNLNSGDGVSTGAYISLRDVGESETISLDGTTGTIDAQQILVQGVPVGGSGGGTISPDTVKANSVQVFSDIGELKADLNYFQPNDAGSVVLYANNDTRNIILGSSGITGGDTGFLGLYDTNDQIKIALRVDTLNGGGQDYGTLILNNSDYSKRLELDGNRSAVIADTVETLEISVAGENFNEKVSIGSENAGYDGVLVLKDSLNNDGAFITTNRGTGTGGYMQLNGRDPGDGSLRSAVVTGTIVDTRQNAFMDIFGGNAANNGAQLLVDVYGSDIDLSGPIPDGYRRGGIDIYNYHGNPTHNFFSEQSGASATSKVILANSQSGVGPEFTVELSSGDGVSTGGLLELRDTIEVTQIRLDGNSGTIDAQEIFIQGVPVMASTDTLNTQDITVRGESDNDKILIGSENAGYDALLVLRDSLNNDGAFITTNRGTGTGGYMQLNGRNSGDGTLRSAVVTGTIVDTRQNAFMDLYGGNAADNGAQLLVDVYASDIDLSGPIPDGYRRGGIDIYNYHGNPTHNFFSEQSGTSATSKIILANSQSGVGPEFTVELSSGDGVSTGGFLALRDTIEATLISMDGNSGNIVASGDVSGGTLTSSDGSVQTSDRRLKKNIADLENPLEKTTQMRGVSYQWKDEDKSQRNQIGVIAQEVEAIYPEFVHTDKHGMKAVNYAQMTAVLIEAIKELNAKVEKLESENSTLKASLSEIETLRKEMNQLMKMLGNSKAASK